MVVHQTIQFGFWELLPTQGYPLEKVEYTIFSKNLGHMELGSVGVLIKKGFLEFCHTAYIHCERLLFSKLCGGSASALLDSIPKATNPALQLI